MPTPSDYLPSRTIILVATGNPALRDRIAQYFGFRRDVRIATANSKDDILPLVKLYQPNIAFLDVDLNEWPAVCNLVTALRERLVFPLLINDTIDEARAVDLVQCGGSGIISPTATEEMFDKCVRSVASGEIWISRQIVPALMARLSAASQKSKQSNLLTTQRAFVIGSKVRLTNAGRTMNDFKLTKRELQIVRAMAEGITNKQIATSLGISELTVKFHLTRVFDKLGVWNRLELATCARRHGLLRLGHSAETQTAENELVA